MTTDIVIVAAARTAVGKFGGTLAKTAAPELGAAVVVDLLRRAKLSGEQINELIFARCSPPARARTRRARPSSRAACRKASRR